MSCTSSFANRSRGGRIRLMSGPIVAAALTVGAGTPAVAQKTDWQYEFTPYIWGAALKGDVQGGSLPKASVDMKFTDVLDVLDFAAMGAFEARKDRWGFLFDFVYMKISDAGTAKRTGAGPIGATLTAHADLKFEQTMFAAAAAYRLSGGRSPVDVIGGLRYTKLDASGEIEASLFGGGPLGLGGERTVSRSADKDWVDPYVGLRIQHWVSDRWTLIAYADVGGFGAGSDLTWQALLGTNYEFSKTLGFKFGYRYMSVDYDKGGFLYDMKTQGLYAGVSFRF